MKGNATFSFEQEKTGATEFLGIYGFARRISLLSSFAPVQRTLALSVEM